MMSHVTLTRERRNQILQCSLLVSTFSALLASGVIFSTPFIRLLPLFLSLFIVMLQAKANRYAYIFGGLNSILYAAIYVYAGIYASAASSFFFSFPIQIFTFWNWSKNPYKKSTKFRTMSTKARILSTLGFLVVWAGVLIALTLIGSSLALLDTSASLLGMTVSILTMLAYKEYAPLWLLSSMLSLVLNVMLTVKDITYFPYAVSATYNLICTFIAFYSVRKLCRIQNTETSDKEEQG